MKVLIIGLGSIARKHINALNVICPGVKLFALRSTDSSTQVDDIVNIFDLASISILDIDFIIVSNPTYKHHETIERLLHLNLPFFIEKPLFERLTGEELVRIIKEKRITTYVACNLRFLGCLKFTKSFLENKRVNEVNIYCGSYLPDWRPGQNFRETYSAKENMGGGVHIDLIHELDYAYWMFGIPNKVRKNISSTSSLEIPAVDYANYLLQYAQFNVNIVLNYYRRDARRTLEIVTEEGTLSVNLLKNEVCWNSEIVFEDHKRIIDTYEDQMRFFIENILLKKVQFNTIEEAYEILKICLEKE